MKSNIFLTRSLIIILLSLLSVILFSQEKIRNNEYQPKEGQEGKDVRWFPTPQTLVEKLLDMAKITGEDFLIDLGSGDGRTVIAAARRGIHAIGIEYNPDMIELSRNNAVKAGVKDKVEFIETDLFKYDFSKATVITMFLLPEINLRLRPKLLGLKPGTRILSTTFSMQDWQYDGVVKTEDKSSKWTTAYLWIIPARIEGTWKLTNGELKLSQVFQMVSGNLNNGGRSVEISEGKLRGNNFTFKADGALYSCTVSGNSMKGTVEKAGKKTDWEAAMQK